MNARSVGRKSGWTVAYLVEEMEELQERLTTAARGLADADAAALAFPSGTELSALDAMQTIVAHWEEHLGRDGGGGRGYVRGCDVCVGVLAQGRKGGMGKGGFPTILTFSP